MEGAMEVAVEGNSTAVLTQALLVGLAPWAPTQTPPPVALVPERLSAPRWGDDVAAGAAVASAPGLALVGAPRAKGPGPCTGAAVLFERRGDAWVQAARLAGDGGPLDQFGAALSLSPDGGRAAVGAFFADGAAWNSGVVHVFEGRGGTWSRSARLVPSNGAMLDAFGAAVCLDRGPAGVGAERLLVGAPYADRTGFQSGAVYLFRRARAGWVQEAELLPGDAQAFDHFGHALALAGGRLVVGSPDHDVWGHDSGAVYVFERIGGAWTEVQRLVPVGAAAGDHFGAALAMVGDQVLAGAPQARPAGATSGALHVFARLGGTWVHTQELVSSRPAQGGDFGAAVAASGGLALVGAPREGASGAAHLFRRRAGRWTPVATLAPPGRGRDGRFGQAVALTGGSLPLLVGAPRAEARCPWGCAAGLAWLWE